MRAENIDITNFDYPLTDERIAKYPLERRDLSKLLFYDGENITDSTFGEIASYIPDNTTLIFNNTKVIRARMQFFKDTGARIEIFCLEPFKPKDYERIFASTSSCEWICMVGNAKKWKSGLLKSTFEIEPGIKYTISAECVGEEDKNRIIKFSWSGDLSFGELLEMLGTIPIPPYLNRASEQSDSLRYQTVYSKWEGSVAAPTAGLHFTSQIIDDLQSKGYNTNEVTLHVGAGTFLPVKAQNAIDHTMHIEHFSVTRQCIEGLIANINNIIAVGTTSVRTLESLSVLGYRALKNGDIDSASAVSQWEAYDIPKEIGGKELLIALLDKMEGDVINGATQIMITPGYNFKIIRGLFTNFHQPQSTLLLLVNAVVGESWREIYNHALKNNYRFLSYGDSSLLLRKI